MTLTYRSVYTTRMKIHIMKKVKYMRRTTHNEIFNGSHQGGSGEQRTPTEVVCQFAHRQEVAWLQQAVKSTYL